MFQWVVIMKCIPDWRTAEGSLMPMLERHLTQVVSDNDKYFKYSDIINMISVFKFWVIGGIFLHMFADALLFDMVLNTAFEDGVDTHEDLIERDMFLGIKRDMKN